MAEHFNGLNSFEVLKRAIENDAGGNEREETHVHKTSVLTFITPVSSCLLQSLSLRKRAKNWSTEISFSFHEIIF
jgi:hypothetical protein